MFHIIFLICLALIWIVFAVVQDIKKREIANWLNFSLIIFALAFRFFYSLFSETDFTFFYQGLIGLGIFFILGNLLYYGRMFAGGDAKLMFAFGAILPLSNNFLINLNIFILFFILFLFSGTFYGLSTSFYLIFTNFKKFKKEFSRQFKQNKNLLILALFLSLFFIILGLSMPSLIYFGIIILIFPYLFLSAKAVDESCLVKKILTKELSEGDWLYKDVKIGNKIIKKSWDGLTEKDIKLLKIKKFILIKQGIPFSPVFLISFLVLIYLWFSGIDLWKIFG